MTAEQFRAAVEAEAERLSQVSSRTVGLSKADWSELDTAIPDLIEMIQDVRNVFFDFAYSKDLDVPGVQSIMRLAARAMQSIENKEARALDRLDHAIRHAPREGR